MLFFFSRAERELNALLKEMRQFLANNYKDAAHECRRSLGEKSEAYYKQGKLSRKRYLYYRAIYNEYTLKMKDYHH